MTRMRKKETKFPENKNYQEEKPNSVRTKTITRMKGRASSQKKRLEKLRAHLRPHILQCLPTEMLVEILAHVGASSAVDLFRCKLSCKALHDIVDEKQVLQRVDIESLYSRIWRNRNKAQSYFRKCHESNNPEAFYRFGMVQYFSQLMMEEGLKNLERAVVFGHKDAIYALGLLLLCSGDKEWIKRGFELLMNLMKEIRGKGIIKCREILKNMMDTLAWMRYGTHMEYIMQEPEIVCVAGELHEIKSNWNKGYYFDGSLEDCIACEACKCHREVDFFCTIAGDLIVRN